MDDLESDIPDGRMSGPANWVREVMHSGVVSCGPDITVQAGAKLMLDAKMRSLVIVDGKCGLAGIVAQSDIVTARMAATSTAAWEATKISEIMTTEVVTVPPDMPLKEAAQIMIRKHIHRVVVASEDDLCTPLGILSMGDIMRAIA